MKVDNDAMLTCLNCGVEGSHELLYLSEHLRASRCANCGKTQVYSGHIYAEYAYDLAERAVRLPLALGKDALNMPIRLLNLPLKAVRKPFGLLREVALVNSFKRGRRKVPNVGDGA